MRFGLLGENGDKTFLRGLESQTKVGKRLGVWGRREAVGEGRRETNLTPGPVFFFPQLVDGQCHISLSKAEVQGALEKVHVSIADLPGLRLYVAAAIIESPGERLP